MASSNNTKKMLLFLEMGVTRKIFNWAAANYFLNLFSGDILLSFLVSFAFLYSCFFYLFVCFLEIKNIYSDTHSTMRAGE